ncbi:MAG: EipB family protein [Stellaceae bacterium]
MIAAALRLLGAAALLGLVLVPPARAGELAPYRALYHLSLVSAKSGSGVVAAGGAVLDEWGETCDGWTEQERFLMRLQYAEQGDEKIKSNLVSWEAKDGLRYRFDERRETSGEEGRRPNDSEEEAQGAAAPAGTSVEEIRGEAKLDGPDKGGTAEFTRPEATTLTLPAGTLFPTAHTLLLIARAQAGDQLITRKLFDGSDLANAAQVTAFIGPRLAPGATGTSDPPLPKAALLDRPSWRIRLAFFPAAAAAGTGGLPDYEETIRLLDNGVVGEMLFDYGDYTIRAKLDDIEALPRPSC